MSYAWIKDRGGIIFKRLSMTSCVAVVETEDSRRSKELLDYAKGLKAKDEPFLRRKKFPLKRIMVFDFWNGLQEMNGDKLEPMEVGVDFGADPITSALKAARQNLVNKAGSGLLLVTGLMGECPTLNQFLASVALDDDVFAVDSTVVVMTSNKRLIAHTALNLCNVVPVESATLEERRALITKLTGEFDAKGITKVDTEAIATTSGGLTQTELEGSMLESYFLDKQFNPAHISQTKAEKIRKAGILKVKMNSTQGFERVGGYEVLKRHIDHNILGVLRQRERAVKLGVTMPKGILLFGPPGTGKTTMGEAMAAEMKLPFLSVTGKDLLGRYVGESEQKTEAFIQSTKEISPCIINFDEMDAISQTRGSGGDNDGGVHRRVYGQLLSWMSSDRDNIVIMTTNRVQDIDPAMLRAGRCDYIYPMFYPDEAARVAIFNVHTDIVRKQPNVLKPADWADLAQQTENWSGAEIEQLVMNAGRLALLGGADAVTKLHYHHAVEDMTVNGRERQKLVAEFKEQAKTYVNSKAFLVEMEKVEASKTKAEIIKEMVTR